MLRTRTNTYQEDRLPRSSRLVFQYSFSLPTDFILSSDAQEQQGESQYDYGSAINQMGTNVNLRYENNFAAEGDTFGQGNKNCPSYLFKTCFFLLGNYQEQLRVVDFPVYVSGQNDPNLTPLVPVN